MAWLAPMRVPLTMPVIEIQAPIWQSSRAAISAGSRFTAARPRPSRRSACSEVLSM